MLAAVLAFASCTTLRPPTHIGAAEVLRRESAPIALNHCAHYSIGGEVSRALKEEIVLAASSVILPAPETRAQRCPLSVSIEVEADGWETDQLKGPILAAGVPGIVSGLVMMVGFAMQIIGTASDDAELEESGLPLIIGGGVGMLSMFALTGVVSSYAHDGAAEATASLTVHDVASGALVYESLGIAESDGAGGDLSSQLGRALYQALKVMERDGRLKIYNHLTETLGLELLTPADQAEHERQQELERRQAEQRERDKAAAKRRKKVERIENAVRKGNVAAAEAYLELDSAEQNAEAVASALRLLVRDAQNSPNPRLSLRMLYYDRPATRQYFPADVRQELEEENY